MRQVKFHILVGAHPDQREALVERTNVAGDADGGGRDQLRFCEGRAGGEGVGGPVQVECVQIEERRGHVAVVFVEARAVAVLAASRILGQSRD